MTSDPSNSAHSQQAQLDTDSVFAELATRRQVLKAGLHAALGAALLTSRPALGRGRGGAGAGLVVYDQQYEASATFGATAAAMGAPVYAIRSDVTRLWQSVLLPRWRTGALIQIGLTGFDALFCLEMVARDWGLRTVYRENYRPNGMGGMDRESPGTEGPHPQEGSEGARWAMRAASYLLEYTERPFGRSDVLACCRSAQTSRGLCKDSLVGWILAPISS